MRITLRQARRAGAWLVGIYLGWTYLQQGLIKFDPAGFWTEAFEAWGYPTWLRQLVGVIEVVGGVGLVLPWIASYSALGLIVVMLGAWGTLARGAHWADLVWPTAYLVALAWIAWEWWASRPRRGRGGAAA